MPLTETDGKHTPGPWKAEGYVVMGDWQASGAIASVRTGARAFADARLIAAAPDMLETLRLHKAWSDSERAGPDYGGQTRDTHPDGERIWRAWWNNQLDLCDRANRATDAAIAKAEGRALSKSA